MVWGNTSPSGNKITKINGRIKTHIPSTGNLSSIRVIGLIAVFLLTRYTIFMKGLRLILCFVIELALAILFVYDLLHFDIAPPVINITAAILEVGGMIWIGIIIKRILRDFKQE